MVSPARPERLLALDVFRGATVAAMLLVNNPGAWGAIHPPLEHAVWHGWTPTDLIFPFFLFIVGVTTHLSLSARRARGDAERAIVRQILRRGGLIVLFGLLLNAFPYYPLERWEHLRFSGVLQRIGAVYVAAALLTRRGSLRSQVGVLAALLFGYWFLMTLVPVPGGILGALALDRPDATLAAWLDRLVLGADHIWQGSRTWDPEGPLSTVPAIGTAMLGVFAGRWITAERPLEARIAGLSVVGGMAMAAGLMWGWSFPINKNLWTSSYVLFTGGMAVAVLAACLWVIDARGLRGWARPFAVYGTNPMIAFVGSGIMARALGSLVRVEWHGSRESLQAALHRGAFAGWLAPRNASLAYAVCFVLVWYGILAVLHRRGIVFRV